MMSSAWKLQVKQARFPGGSLRIASTTSSGVRVSRLSPSCVVLTSILLRFVWLGSQCFCNVEHSTESVLPVLGRLGVRKIEIGFARQRFEQAMVLRTNLSLSPRKNQKPQVP